MSQLSDRNLLLGILADEMGVVDRERLIAVMQACTAQPESSLGELLVERGDLHPDQRAWLERAVERQLRRHGDARSSIKSLGVEASAQELLSSAAGAERLTSLGEAGAAGPGSDSAPSAAQPTAPSERFRIIRRHAAGGLGEVFLARDEGLHRDVALKEIQTRCAGDADLCARFVLEAEITGSLEHPNIVPVYDLGRQPDGRPFYVMRFIRGDNLLSAIQRFHSEEAKQKPAGDRMLPQRGLLGCFIHVCNATAYAHSRGVIHRDLKPENVMLGPYGETLLVDWGLAKLVQRDRQDLDGAAAAVDTAAPASTLHPAAAAGPAPTQFGSLVGTLAYMSPEQAAGLVDQLGPASDIYSLGAVLYVLLTGCTPFAGGTVDRIRQHIILGKFPPPRKVDPHVDPALQAICLKAMAQDSSRRYRSARALAEDVEAWLAGEPVQAWHEPWRVRAGRWVRRHRTLCGGAVAAVLVAAISLAVGVILLTAANERERVATAFAEQQEQQARHNFQMARDAVDKYLTHVSDDPRLKAQNLERLRRDLLETAREFYEQFIRQDSDEPELRSAWGWAHVRLAVITAETGSKQRAIELLEQARQAFLALSHDYPAEAEYRARAVQADLDLARLHCEVNHPEEASAVLREARTLAAELVQREPQAPTLRAALASVHAQAAQLHLDQQEWDRAEDEYRAAIAIRGPLLNECPEVAEYQSQLAAAQTALGLLYRQTSRRDEALVLLVSAADGYQKLADKHRDVPEYWREAGTAFGIVALVHDDLGSPPDRVEGAYRSALGLRQRLARSHPDVSQYQRDLARSHFQLALFCWKTGRLEQAATSFRDAQKALEQLIADDTEVPAYRQDLASVWNNLGLVYRALGRTNEGITALRAAIEIRRKLVGRQPENRAHSWGLSSSHGNLGDLLLAQRQLDEAAAAYRAAVASAEKLLAAFPQDLQYTVDLGAMYLGAGRVAQEQGRPEEAHGAIQKAVKVLAGRSVKDRESPTMNSALGEACSDSAEILSRCGRHEVHDLGPRYAKLGSGLYRLAITWASALAAVAADTSLAPAERDRLADEYAAASLAALRQCRDSGLLNNPPQVARLKADPDLAPLRARADFQQFVAAL